MISAAAATEQLPHSCVSFIVRMRVFMRRTLADSRPGNYKNEPQTTKWKVLSLQIGKFSLPPSDRAAMVFEVMAARAASSIVISFIAGARKPAS
jgi:hypothetical protein